VITTHVLDIGRGGPATGVVVVLEVRQGSQWARLASGRTDDRGRLTSLTDNLAIAPGLYRLTFDTGAYHRAHGATAFFPEVQVTFDVRDAAEHFHVPLVISAFGYSTYRGA
jgi:5-hydroxyisourate hydrolase